MLWEGIFCYWWYLTAFPVIPQSHYLSAGQRSWMSLVIVYTSLTVFEFLIFQFVLCVYMYLVFVHFTETPIIMSQDTLLSPVTLLWLFFFLNHEVILVFSNTSHGFSRPVLFAYTLFSLSNFQACAPLFFPFHLFVLQHRLRWMISVSQIRPWWTF